MKIIQFIDGIVVDILNAREDITADTIAIADSIPTFEPREGFNGILKYSNENGLYWDYVEIETNNEITDEEFINMIEEVM
jgi:hypothetical protein